MTAITHNIAFYEGSKISYESYGQGSEALVFVHGWSCDSTLWYLQSPVYQSERAILIDLPGHGKSDAPDIDYHQEMFARAVEVVLRQEDIKKIVMVGHSMGGPVSMMFLRLFPDMVEGIVFVDSFFRSPEHYFTIRQRREFIEAVKGEKFKMIFTNGWTDKSSSEEKQLVARVAFTTPEHVRISAVTTDSLPHAYRWDEIFEIPALLLATGDYPVDELWRHHLPQLEVEDWKGFSHFLFMEDPDRFNETVLSFLRRYKLLSKSAATK